MGANDTSSESVASAAQIAASLEPATMLDDVFPLFVLEHGIDDTILQALVVRARSEGWSLFYIVGQEASEYTQQVQGAGMHKVTVHSPKVFKCVVNIAGYAFMPEEDEDIGLATVGSAAWFSMPQIPMELINKVDEFFRSVYTRLGTESVILFTYDNSYIDSDDPTEGWGVLVPKQENTAGSCDYDASSVVDELPDGDHEIYIVGTAHSHPNMEAFCSGTDKADQANFDGIHITYGWRDGSPKTNYHIELQMSGTAFTFKPKQVFTSPPEEQGEFTNEHPWIKQVSKAKPAANFTQGTGTTKTGTGSSTNYNNGLNTFKSKDFSGLPEGLPEPGPYHTVIHTVLVTKAYLKECPVCQDSAQFVLSNIKNTGKCNSCFSFIITADFDTIDEFIQHRIKKNLRDSEFNGQSFKHVWLWEEIFNGNQINERVTLWAEGSNNAPEATLDKNVNVSEHPMAPGLKAGKAKGTSTKELTGPSSFDLHCGRCGEPITHANDFCTLCYDDTELDGRLLVAGAIDKINKRNAELTLCCGGDIDECSCGESMKLTFTQAEETFYTHGDLDVPIYDQNNGCEQCIFSYSSQCPDYRSFLKNFVSFYEGREHNGLILKGDITICEKFLPTDRIQDITKMTII